MKEDLEIYLDNKDKIATLGWFKEFVLESKIFSVEALNVGVSYLTENMYKHEDVIVTDNMEMKNYQVAAMMSSIFEYYEINGIKLSLNEITINNYYYANSDSKTKNSSKGVILAILISLYTGGIEEASKDIYQVIKSGIIKESHYEVNSLVDHLKDKTEVYIYEDDKLNAERMMFMINDTQIETVKSLDGWYQVYYISQEKSGFGYIRK